jgi:hypothetical protein
MFRRPFLGSNITTWAGPSGIHQHGTFYNLPTGTARVGRTRVTHSLMFRRPTPGGSVEKIEHRDGNVSAILGRILIEASLRVSQDAVPIR